MKYIIFTNKNDADIRLLDINNSCNFSDGITKTYSNVVKHYSIDLFGIPILVGYENLFTELEKENAIELTLDWFNQTDFMGNNHEASKILETIIKDINGIILPQSQETYSSTVLPCKFWVMVVKQNTINNSMLLLILVVFYDDNGDRTYINDTVNWLDISNNNQILFPDGNRIGAYDLASQVIDITVLRDAYIMCFQLDEDDYYNGKDSLIKRVNIYK